MSAKQEAEEVYGGWRHNNGYLINHTIRVARADFDTDPSEAYKQSIFDFLCEAANNYERVVKELEATERKLAEADKMAGVVKTFVHTFDREGQAIRLVSIDKKLRKALSDYEASKGCGFKTASEMKEENGW